MSNNAALIAVGVVGAVLLLKKKTAMAARPATGSPTAQPSTNLNGDMWARLLGKSWQSMLQAGMVNQGAGGNQPFVMRNLFGQVVTSDGTPVSSGDPLSDWVSMNTGLPTTYADYVQNPAGTFSDSIDSGLAWNQAAGSSAGGLGSGFFGMLAEEL